jgi:prepilin-type N-terminal cleavage/methylation domain-containing protein
MIRRTRRGFTVTEMMVVIGVFVVLIGLVIPATSKVRTSAMRTQCLSQMRGLQFAHLAYAQDNRGRFVDSSPMLHSGMTDEQIEAAELPYWYFSLQQYYDTPLVLKSPLDDSDHWPASMGGNGVPTPQSANSFRRTSYGMNDYLMAHNPAQWDNDDPENAFDRLSKIRNPANTINFAIVAFAGDNAGSDHFHTEQWLESAFLPFPIEQFATRFVQTDAYGGKYRTWDARSGYSFLDGSVTSQRFSDVVSPEDSRELNKFNPRAAVAYTARQIINR